MTLGCFIAMEVPSQLFALIGCDLVFLEMTLCNVALLQVFVNTSPSLFYLPNVLSIKARLHERT